MSNSTFKKFVNNCYACRTASTLVAIIWNLSINAPGVVENNSWMRWICSLIPNYIANDVLAIVCWIECWLMVWITITTKYPLTVISNFHNIPMLGVVGPGIR